MRFAVLPHGAAIAIKPLGDLNGDGTVNIADVTALITLVLHHN